MLIKSKICFTALAVYEMLAVTFLHFKRLCDSFFSAQFCDSWYRYFLFCVIVPVIVLLILMWIREIVRYRRRRTFIRRARNTISGIISSLRGRITENIDVRDMEKIITAAVLVGIKKYADRHPSLRDNVNHVMDVANGAVELDVVSTAEPVKPRSRSTKNTSRKKTTAKKKK